jgi:transposase
VGDIFLFQDECSMSNTADVSYKWSEKGKQPMIQEKQYKRERVTLFGAVNTISGEVIVQQAERGNGITFLKYLKKIIRFYKNTKGKIHLILDNVRYHHAKILKPFLEKNKDKLELMFLPAYSPDLNPIERVWWYMRKKITNNRYVDTLKNRMIEFWKMFSHYQKPNQLIVNLCNLNYSV